MRLQITIHVDEPITLADAAELFHWSIRKYQRFRTLGEGDKGTGVVARTSDRPAAEVHWKVEAETKESIDEG